MGNAVKYPSNRGFLRVQKGNDLEQSTFIKFPTDKLKASDQIIGAALRLYKTGGKGGSAEVELSACSFERNTLTYTSSRKLAQGDDIKEQSGGFPSGTNEWVAIKLKPAVLQSARSQGSFICLEVSGGPKTEPSIFASELTSNKPELK